MDLRITHGFLSPLPGSKSGKPQESGDSANSTAAKQAQTGFSGPTSPIETHISPVQPIKQAAQTRLLTQTQEDTENGQRRTQVFEKADGRQFTRVEEIGLTQSGARRTVIQQNPSGSITRYEEVLDKEPAGTFRRTQRFQNEAGEIAAQITQGYAVRDPFILTGGSAAFKTDSAMPFAPTRGTQLDLRA